ncbi:unnamed protein product [Orchesella dallaii]|uniref:Caprin-1 dimerization domain-containing protein n=1 Tax=Orchesella dallaii TaxID=48710 RepID=A0ABP1Q2B0_9HEXA
MPAATTTTTVAPEPPQSQLWYRPTGDRVLEPFSSPIVAAEHKIRNLEKRKLKLDQYRNEQSEGKTLNADQLAAVAKYNEVIQQLEHNRELVSCLRQVHQQTIKFIKQEMRRENGERNKFILSLHAGLDQLQNPNVQHDFLVGEHGAVKVTEEDLTDLTEVSKLIRPSLRESDFALKIETGAEVVAKLFESRGKVNNKPSHQLKTMIDSIVESQYFTSGPTPIVPIETVEEVVPRPQETPNPVHVPEIPMGNSNPVPAQIMMNQEDYARISLSDNEFEERDYINPYTGRRLAVPVKVPLQLKDLLPDPPPPKTPTPAPCLAKSTTVKPCPPPGLPAVVSQTRLPIPRVVGRFTPSPSVGQPRRSQMLEQTMQSPVIGQSKPSPGFGHSMQPPIIRQPMQSPVYGQPTQSPVYGQPTQSPIYGQSIQSPVIGQPIQSPGFGQVQPRVIEQSMQSPVYGQPMQTPSIGQLIQYQEQQMQPPMIGQPMQTASIGQPIQYQEQQMQPPMIGQPMQTASIGQPIQYHEQQLQSPMIGQPMQYSAQQQMLPSIIEQLMRFPAQQTRLSQQTRGQSTNIPIPIGDYRRRYHNFSRRNAARNSTNVAQSEVRSFKPGFGSWRDREMAYSFMQESQLEIESPHMDPAVVAVSSYAPPPPQIQPQPENNHVFTPAPTEDLSSIQSGVRDLNLNHMNSNNGEEEEDWDDKITTATFNNSTSVNGNMEGGDENTNGFDRSGRGSFRGRGGRGRGRGNGYGNSRPPKTGGSRGGFHQGARYGAFRAERIGQSDGETGEFRGKGGRGFPRSFRGNGNAPPSAGGPPRRGGRGAAKTFNGIHEPRTSE